MNCTLHFALPLSIQGRQTHWKNSIFLNDFGSWKIWSEEKKPEANFFGSEGSNSTQLFWILKTQKMLAEGFFFLNSKFWSWKGVQNELFLYWITFLPCSYEAKVKNKNLFFPRENKILFFPDSPNTIRNGAGKKSNPLYFLRFCNLEDSFPGNLNVLWVGLASWIIFCP